MAEQEVRTDINPQLCKTMNPNKHTWEHEWIAEPKFDGLRCYVVTNSKGKASAHSRNGKPLWNMDIILEEIENAGFKDYVLDGEVYTKDWNLSMGIVKSSVTAHPDRDKLQFHMWDFLLGSELRTSWYDARKVAHQGYSSVPNVLRKKRLDPFIKRPSPHVKVVEGVIVKNTEELQIAYQNFLTMGFEGAILKHPQGSYEGGRRSPNWLKIKPWTDADLTVVGAYPGEGKHIGRIGGLVLEGSAEWNGTSYDIHTEVGTGFTDDERVYWQVLVEHGNHIGKTVEIKFQDITVDGACRFPVYNRLREDK